MAFANARKVFTAIMLSLLAGIGSIGCKSSSRSQDSFSREPTISRSASLPIAETLPIIRISRLTHTNISLVDTYVEYRDNKLVGFHSPPLHAVALYIDETVSGATYYVECKSVDVNPVCVYNGHYWTNQYGAVLFAYGGGQRSDWVTITGPVIGNGSGLIIVSGVPHEKAFFRLRVQIPP